MAGLSVFGLAALSALAGASPASAAPYSVTSSADSGAGSLRDAIAAANASPALDTITFAPSVATVSLTGAAISITDPVTITGPGSAALVISRSGTGNVFDVAASTGTDTTISGLTITGGQGGNLGGAIEAVNSDVVLDDLVLTLNSANQFGGGIYAHFGTLVVTDSRISGNHAGSRGGGIYTLDTDTTLTDVDVLTNTSSSTGGGVYINGGPLTMADSTISGNTSSAQGGGLYLKDVADAERTGVEISGNGSANSAGGSVRYSTVSFEDSLIADNIATYGGGGINFYQGTGTVEATTISGNRAGGDGGGLYAYSDSELTVLHSTITDNHAVGVGGGIYAYDDTDVVVRDSTISGNSAVAGGAVFTSRDTALTLENSTISENISAGPTILLEQVGRTAVDDITFDHVTVADNDATTAVSAANPVALDILNSIVVGSVGTDDVINPLGTTNITYSLLGRYTPGLAPTLGNDVGGDPLLAPLSNTGGPTETMVPADGSPVIDTGNPVYSGLTTDQRGGPRTAESVLGGVVQTDMGAVEVVSAPPPNPPPPNPPPPVAPTPVVPATVPTTTSTLTTDRGVISRIAAGQQVTVIGTGFAPFSRVDVVLYPGAAVLDSVTTDADGSFRAPVTVPGDLAVGAYSLVAAGFAPDGSSRYLRLDVEVAADGVAQLASTGADAEVLVPAGLGLVGVGGLLAGLGLRRRRSTV